MKLTITLTKQQKAAAKRLQDNFAGRCVPHYDRVRISTFYKRVRMDNETLANVVLAAIAKAGAK